MSDLTPELPEGVWWFARQLECLPLEWIPASDDVAAAEADYTRAAMVASWHPEDQGAQARLKMARERLDNLEAELHMLVLDHQLAKGFITDGQHSMGEIYIPQKPHGVKPDF